MPSSLTIGATRPAGMKPVFENAENMPCIGEEVYVPNNVTGKYECLKCVFIKEDHSMINKNVVMFHVFFASPEAKDNEHVDAQSGILYYTIRTYGMYVDSSMIW